MGCFHVSAIFMICLVFPHLFMGINAYENEVEDEHPFSYSANATKGPEKWGHIDPNWQICETGKLQSPIDLLDDRVEVLSKLGTLKRTYKPAPAVLKNRGHDVMVAWKGDAGGVIINGTEYELVQCHWHTPSEHSMDGHKFNMELHMVHNNSEGQIAVIGVMYKFGHPDKFVDKFLHNLHKLGDEEGMDLGVVDPWDVKFGSRKYFRYFGSLTVPPCTEGVLWTILKKVRTVSREQIRALRDVVHDGFENNARPTQQRDGRTVYMYRPSCV